MPTLFFKKQFLEQIKTGQKTSTIRLKVRMHTDDIVTCLSGREQVKVRITSIRKITTKEITADIAKTDGFTSRTQLMKTLKQLYPHSELRELYYLTFVPVASHITP